MSIFSRTFLVHFNGFGGVGFHNFVSCFVKQNLSFSYLSYSLLKCFTNLYFWIWWSKVYGLFMLLLIVLSQLLPFLTESLIWWYFGWNFWPFVSSATFGYVSLYEIEYFFLESVLQLTWGGPLFKWVSDLWTNFPKLKITLMLKKSWFSLKSGIVFYWFIPQD